MRGLVWFKADLRVTDNMALSHAARACDQVCGIYFIDYTFWKKHDVANCRIDFELAGLSLLQDELAALNIPLIILQTTHTDKIPSQILALMEKNNFCALFYNKQYEVNECKRDQAVEKLLTKNQISVHSYDDQLILSPLSVKTNQKTFYSVFTPYKRAWKNVFRKSNIHSFSRPRKQNPLNLKISTHKLPAFSNSALWPAGEKAAAKRLKKFITDKLFVYHQERDFPALDGTSKLSPYLASGMISPRQCFLAALTANQNELDTGNKGALTWMDELIWREFYKQILISAPRVSMHQAYKKETNNIKWDYNKDLFNAWKKGQTGYPLIDAAMRQLHQTNWMHNRLRMVVAMFLTKNLFLDWHEGEKYFMQHLIDGDLAANNGGWQWSASTGTDSAPYFRIFNPIRQSERFDPDAKFILQYCPELKGMEKKKIHNPQGEGYIQPIIDLNAKRNRVLKAYKTAARAK